MTTIIITIIIIMILLWQFKFWWNDNKKQGQKAANMSQRIWLIGFCNEYIEFKYHLSSIQLNVTEKILLLEEHVKSLETEDKELQDTRKAQWNVISKPDENLDVRKKTLNDWMAWITVISNNKKENDSIRRKINEIFWSFKTFFSSANPTSTPTYSIRRKNANITSRKKINKNSANNIGRRTNRCICIGQVLREGFVPLKEGACLTDTFFSPLLHEVYRFEW